MNNLGEDIRNKRIAKGMSVEDLSEKTMLSVAVIKDIENGAFDRYEGDETYVKMYLKKISKALDLDTEEVTQTYIALTEEIKKIELEEANKALEKSKAELERRKQFQFENPKFATQTSVYEDKSYIKIIRGVIVLLLIALIVFIVHTAISKTKTLKQEEPFTPDNQEVVDNTPVEPETPVTPVEPVTPEPTVKDEIKITRKSNFKYTVTLPEGTKKYTLKVKFNKRSWSTLTVDGKTISKYQSTVYDKGTVKEVKLKVKNAKKLVLRNANGKGSKYYINGKKIPLTASEKAENDITLTIKIK